MTPRRWTLHIALASALFVLGASCSGRSSPGTGSETNWLACETSADCAVGACLCGHCATACAGPGDCPRTSGEVACKGPDSPAFASLCTAAESRPSGLCLETCAQDADCPGGFRCEAGACVPTAVSTASIGATCIPADEARPGFAGFSESEIAIDDRVAACATRVCLAYHFRGRVTCPYGQAAGGDDCATPHGLPVPVAVAPQLIDRRASETVYCSCRCGGAGPGPYCTCPAGFACEPVAEDVGFASSLSGSYCIKAGTEVTDPAALASAPGPSCDAARHDCDAPGR